MKVCKHLTNFKRTYYDGINRNLKKKHFYRVLTNGDWRNYRT